MYVMVVVFLLLLLIIICIHIAANKTNVVQPTKPLSDHDSGVRHSFEVNSSLP